MMRRSRRLRDLGWQFDVEEVSANVYRVRGYDAAGRTVEATGIDPDQLLERCKKDAFDLLDATSQSSQD